MRIVTSVFALVLVGAAATATPAQAGKGRQNPAQVHENAKEEAVDALAAQAFKQADGNHNGVLSRSEAVGAEELLQAGIMNLVQQGTLGVPQGKKQGKNGKNQVKVQAPNGAAVFGAPPASDKKGKNVSLAEFKAYAHTLAQQTDAEWARMRATQMQARGRSGGRGRGMNWPNPPPVAP
jgi:hypothetical protein